MRSPYISLFFFFNDTATTEIYTLSLHDALPICRFDITKWQRYLSSASEEFRAQIEQLYREYLPERKLQEYLTADVYVSDAKLWRIWRDQHESVTVAMLHIRPDQIPDSCWSRQMRHSLASET